MDAARLSAITIFSELSPEESRRLAAFATETSAAAGEVLMKQGDFATELIAIEEVTAEVRQGGTVLAELNAGDLIGEIGLIERRPRSADVVATSPMRLIKLTHWEIRRMSDATVDRIKQLVAARQPEAPDASTGTADA